MAGFGFKQNNMSLVKKAVTTIVSVMFITVGICHAQTLAGVNDLAEKHQACLDEGKDMLGCTSRFYSQMDSLLNLAYNNLRKKMSEADKNALKIDQRDWLKKRDAYFKKQEQEVTKEMDAPKSQWGEMQYMVLYDAEANFVKDRVTVLIRKSEEL